MTLAGTQEAGADLEYGCFSDLSLWSYVSPVTSQWDLTVPTHAHTQGQGALVAGTANKGMAARWGGLA